MRRSVLNLGRYPPSRLIDLARLQEDCGYETFWYADERFFREVYTGLTLAALHTQRIQVGTMVTDPYTRHPALTAMALASLDEIAAGRAILGLGAGVSGFAEMQIMRRKPVQAMRETVAFVDAVTLAGTVEEVAARVAHLQQLGVTHVLINPLAPDDDVEHLIRTFAQEVMPRVNERVA
jgi:5,10-methylenetetrahydromethanopterin reductase